MGIGKRTPRLAASTRILCAIVVAFAAVWSATEPTGFQASADEPATTTSVPIDRKPGLATAIAPTSNGSNQAVSPDLIDPLARDSNGIQRRYPSVAKIRGRASSKTREDGARVLPLFYGTGCYVAEIESWGIVVTNWHVVSEANESLTVVFPGREEVVCRVILKDEIWDLAALAIRKPEGMRPLPISYDVPKIGDSLWVGGYGSSQGLEDFKMSSGRLNTYVSLVDPDAAAKPAGQRAAAPAEALYETFDVGCCVRHGDSGGPILNQYGELAGLLWGSDDRSTMGTPGARLQAFLTQAIIQAAKIRACCALSSYDPDDFSLWDVDPTRANDASDCDEPMEEALKRAKMLPICSNEVYESPDGVLDAVRLAAMRYDEAKRSVKEAADARLRKATDQLPPFPPIFSPSFVKQQRVLNCVRPDAPDKPYLSLLCQNWMRRFKENQSAKAEKVMASAGASSEQNGTGPLEEIPGAAEPIAAMPVSRPKTVDSDENALDARLGEPPENAIVTEESVKSLPTEEEKEYYEPKANGRTLTYFQVYVVACALFAFFCISASLINQKEEKNNRKGENTRE